MSDIDVLARYPGIESDSLIHQRAIDENPGRTLDFGSAKVNIHPAPVLYHGSCGFKQDNPAGIFAAGFCVPEGFGDTPAVTVVHSPADIQGCIWALNPIVAAGIKFGTVHNEAVVPFAGSFAKYIFAYNFHHKGVEFFEAEDFTFGEVRWMHCGSRDHYGCEINASSLIPGSNNAHILRMQGENCKARVFAMMPTTTFRIDQFHSEGVYGQEGIDYSWIFQGRNLKLNQIALNTAANLPAKARILADGTSDIVGIWAQEGVQVEYGSI